MCDYKMRQAFAQNLNVIMEQRGVGQVDVVNALSIPNSTISDWCLGKAYPRIDKLVPLAQYLHCSINDLTVVPEGMQHGMRTITQEESIELITMFERLPRQVRKVIMDFTRTAYNGEGQNR